MDNAATTFPKPDAVAVSITEFIRNVGASAGRSGHRLSVTAGRVIYEAREEIASFFNAADPLKVIFALNATSALNTAFYGILEKGDAVAVSDVEHNSVMRPLRELAERKGVKIAVVRTLGDLTVDPDDLRIKSKGVKLVSLVHGNNVTGAVSDIKSLSRIAHENGAYFMTDAAQTAGVIKIDMESDGIDILCASGHKGLYGPQGTGILIFGKNINGKKIKTLVQGGTGSRSEEERHPEALPDKFEAGTGNYPGIAGLSAAVKWLSGRGFENNYSHEKKLRDKLLEGLKNINRVKPYASETGKISTGTLSFNVEGMEASETGRILDSSYGIMTRVGLHCAPAAHKRIGTFPYGAVRLSVGAFTTEADADFTINAIKEISGGK